MMVMRNIVLSLLFVLLIQIPSNLSGQFFFASIKAGGETEICQGESVPAIITVWGGTSPYVVVINDDDGKYLELKNIESGHTFDIMPETDNTYYIESLTDSRGRNGYTFGSVSVTVNPSTPVSIVLERTAFLETESGIRLRSSPSGGTFEGKGVKGSTFYPEEATTVGSPHRITCTYVNQYGCSSQDHEDLYVLTGESSVHLYSGGDIITFICNDGTSYVIKGNNEDNLAGTFELYRTGSSIPVQGHISDDDLTDNEATLLTEGLTGTYEIFYTYGIGGLEIEASTEFRVDNIRVTGIQGLPGTVCKNDNPYILLPELNSEDPNSTYSFSGPGVSGNQSAGYSFDPADPDVPLGLMEIVLDFTSSNGCTSEVSVMVDVGVIPVVDFTLDQICLAPEGSSVSFSNLTSHKNTVAEWSWDFGDPASGENNSSSLENPDHFYAEAGSRTIILSATTDHGCFARHELDTLLVDEPVVDFTWVTDCYTEGESTHFTSSVISDYADPDTLLWTIRLSEGGVLAEIGKNPAELTLDYLFSSKGQYDVTLFAENTAGCQGEYTSRIELRPVHMLSHADYMETFNDLAEDWSVVSEDQLESWILSEPDFAGFEQVENDKAWYTDLPDYQEDYLEHSWVLSPCFDFSGVNSPVIQLDLMKSFSPGDDGAVLQYQDDINDGWKTIGTVGEGTNWYNVSTITHKPGGSNIGWGLNQFEPDREWITADHSLGMLTGISDVKFRIAIATGSSEEIAPNVFNQGFAFDNFFIREESRRRSVLEYFTNTAGDSIRMADEAVGNFATKHSAIVYDLHYHMDYPEKDPMNINNPLPPSTRAFNYGVPDVPYAVLNGGATPEYRFDFTPSGELDDEVLISSSMETPLFELSLSVDYQENSLEGNVTVICQDDNFDSYLQLYIVVIEKEVTTYYILNQDTIFRNVVLDMLPLPTGTLLGNNWSSGTTSETAFTWDYAEYIEDIEDLSVVAFVQDRDNGWVLQASAVSHTPGVGISGKIPVNNTMAIYPNPVGQTLNINFGTRTKNEGQLIIMDISGREVLKTNVPPGYTTTQLDISHLPDGIFTLFWKESGMMKGHAKLVRNQ